MTDTQPVLPAGLLDQLIDTGNKALNDYYHERACSCSTWPEKCASWKKPGDMFFGYWDTNAFAIALSAIIAAYEQHKTRRIPGDCACGRNPDPGICPTSHENGLPAGGHCACVHDKEQQ